MGHKHRSFQDPNHTLIKHIEHTEGCHCENVTLNYIQTLLEKGFSRVQG